MRGGSKRGRIFTDEHRRNLSLAHIGLPGNNKGSKPQAVRDKISASLTGTHLSESHKQAIGRANRRWYESLSESEKGKYNRQRIVRQKRYDTQIERNIAEQLDGLNVQYVKQYPVGRFVVDFFLPEYQSVIEGYGCYWHGCVQCGRGKRRNADARREQAVSAAGLNLLVIWEHSLNIRKELSVWLG